MERKATAYHEAGHAVAAIENRVKLIRVSIIPDDDSSGRCNYTYPEWKGSPDSENNSKWRYRLEKLAIGTLSGMAAEGLYLGHDPEDGYEDDQHRAICYLSYLTGSNEELGAYFEWIKRRARGLVRTPIVRLTIEAVAEVLLDKQVLSGTEVRAIRTVVLGRLMIGLRARTTSTSAID